MTCFLGGNENNRNKKTKKQKRERGELYMLDTFSGVGAYKDTRTP
jgi:hypothetical protein